jgi:hypothetical protein
MSKHECGAWMNGKRVIVLAGWDVPLQGFFLVVEESPVDDDSDEYIYSNLRDPALKAWMGLPPDLDYFVGKLRELGIEVPPRMLAEVAADKLNNVSARRVTYTQQGVMAEGA